MNIPDKSYKNHNLLIVDDEIEIQYALRRQFRRICNVYTATSAEEGMKILADVPIHAIISDQRMPQITGSEFLANAKIEHPDAVRMLLTGYADIQAVIQAINDGRIFRYITKPWDAGELETIVREAFDRYDIIMENRWLVEKLRRYNEELEQMVADRTAKLKQANETLILLHKQKDWFLGMAAHDLRSPLAVVISVIDLVTEDYNLSQAEKDEMMGMIKGSVKGLLYLIDDLLDITAIQTGQISLDKQPMSLGDLLMDIVALDRHLAEAKQIRLVADVAPDLPILTIDPERIRQVTNNLLSNAIKFSHSKTEVILRARVVNDAKDGGPEGGGADCVEVSVIDQGQGINATEIDKLFKDFQRTTTRPTGDEPSSGLGLSISKRLVNLHGGQIGAESTHGVGSRFYFTLPIAPSSTPPIPNPQSPA